MARTPMWRRYLRLFGADVAGDVEDEIRFHLEVKTEELVREGWTREAAREKLHAGRRPVRSAILQA